MIANKVENGQEGRSLYEKLDTVVARYLKIPITYLGMIPQDAQLAKAVMQQMPVSIQNPDSKSAQAYEVLAAKLMNKELNKTLTKRGMAAFFSHIISKR